MSDSTKFPGFQFKITDTEIPVENLAIAVYDKGKLIGGVDKEGNALTREQIATISNTAK